MDLSQNARVFLYSFADGESKQALLLFFSSRKTQQPLLVLIMGASGDLAKKKTYPALYELWNAKVLPATIVIYGLGRTRHTHQQLRQRIT